VQQAARLERRFAAEARHLHARVHARIGATGARDLHRCLAQLLERRHQLALHGAQAGLHLPAVEIRAVVFEIEPVGGHRRHCAPWLRS
jgi:hypothetical protein